MDAVLHSAQLPDAVRDDVGRLVRGKLQQEPVEDLRIDFEDGYGDHGDDEDDDVVAAARSVVADIADGSCPPFVGIRFKCFERPTRARGLRTLDLFVGTLLEDGQALPPGLVVTLPKVTSVEQVTAMAMVCAALEQAHGLPAGRLRFEVQVETPQAVQGPDGTALVSRMVQVGDGRVSGLHYGTYDYSASLGIAAAHQSMEHPAADHAKAVMQLAAAGTGVRVSDGSTNVLPVGDADAVQAAWALHARLVQRSLARGYYQGWDMHPAQLPTRYAATYAFFRQGLDEASRRLRAYIAREGGAVMDEPATAKALAAFLQRGVDCAAVTREELRDLAGLTVTDLAALMGRRPGEGDRA
jgi:citrate lyase beta subunit